MWVAVLNGFIGSMAAFGTDQDLMQRLLTVETRRREPAHALHHPARHRRSPWRSIWASGAALYTFYAQHPALPVSRPDEILPHFVQQVMPAVLRGLMLSAIVLASIDSPLGALASSFVTDIYRPLLVRGPIGAPLPAGVAGQRGGLRGAAGAGWPTASRSSSGILWLAFKIAGVTFGSLLGVFLLGLLTRRRVADGANVAAMVVMAVVNLVLLVLIETGSCRWPGRGS